MTLELAPGIYGGAKSLAAFLQYLGLNSPDELEPIGSDEVQMQLDLREAA